MTIEYFYKMGAEDAKKLMEQPEEYNIDYVTDKIDEIKRTNDNECAQVYALGFIAIIKSNEKTR